MTELHLIIAIFEKRGHKVEVIAKPLGYEVYVENSSHQRIMYIFNPSAEYIEFKILES